MTGCQSRIGIEVAHRRQSLGGDPQAETGAGRADDRESRRAARRRELLQPARPAGVRRGLAVGDDAERDQRLVHLVGVARARPGFVANARDRVGVEPAELVGALGVGVAAVLHRLRPALLDRRVVEERVRPRAQRLGGERRRRRHVARDHLDRARLDPAQQREPAGRVHRVVEAVAHRLRDQRVLGDFAVAGEVLGARDLVGEDRRRAGPPTSSAAAAARPSCRR